MSVLAVVRKRMQQLPTVLGFAEHRGKDRTRKTLEMMCNVRVWPQQCWKSCENVRIQRCCAKRRRSRNKRNVGSCWLKRLTGFKLCATRNNMQQSVQTDATCNTQECWESLQQLMLRPFARS